MYRYAADATLTKAAKYCFDLLVNSPHQTKSSKSHKLLLILGVDGSGKTIAHMLAPHTGAVTHEATGGPHGRGLKKLHYRREVDAHMVHMREYMYASLNRVFQREIQAHLKNTDVITTGSLLVTRLANYTMRRVIGEPNEKPLTAIVDEWLAGSDQLPDEIIYLHAPIDIIMERILARLQAGDIHELPVAYNSPFYLDEYDKVLGEAIHYISQNTSIPISIYDTSTMSPDDLSTSHISFPLTDVAALKPRKYSKEATAKKKYKYSAKEAAKFNKYGIDLTVYEQSEPSANISGVSVKRGHFQEFYNTKSAYSYYIVRGNGTFFLDGEPIEVSATDLVVAPPNTRIYYFGTMEMVLMVAPAWNEADEHHVRFVDESENPYTN